MSFVKGNIPWNAGKHMSDETRKKMSDSKKGKAPNNKGCVPWNKGISPSEETRYKIGSANRGKKFSAERCENISKGHIGQNTWSKGRKASDESRKKMSETRKGKPGHPCSEETKEKLREALTGKILSPERRKSISEGHKGLKKSPETCAKISVIHTGMRYSDETKLKCSESQKKLWENPEHAKKCLCINSPNKQEIKLMGILNSMYPNEWKFVGNGQVIIAGKCPDFININGKKKIIELYGERWHQGEDPKDREAIFAPFGYTTLVIWQKELSNKSETIRRIKEFMTSAA